MNDLKEAETEQEIAFNANKRRASIDNESKIDDVINNNNNNNVNNNEAVLNTYNHRRRNTDGSLGMKLNGKPSNAEVIETMANNLPENMRSNMRKKSNELRLERELKHLMEKYRESEEQCKTAVEIIGNLQRENEDYNASNENYRTQIGSLQTEIKILEQKIKSLQEIYQTETEQYKHSIAEHQSKVAELKENVAAKDYALAEAKEYQKNIDSMNNNNDNMDDEDEDDNDNDDNGNSNKHKFKTNKEKKLYFELQEVNKKLMERDNKIDSLLLEVASNNKLKQEMNNLKIEMSKLQDMAKEDLTMQDMQIKKMQTEIIALASRNSNLEREKEDLIAMLEEREYETEMLKTGYGLHQEQASLLNLDSSNNKQHFGNMTLNNMGGSGNINNNMGLAFMENDNDEVINIDNNYYANEQIAMDNNNNNNNATPKEIQPPPIKKKEKDKKQTNVPDVIREYLHLTASVVNIKFPMINHITSEELINKVKNYQFYEYHDMMVEIMKTEVQKIKDENEKKLQNEQQKQLLLLQQQQQQQQSKGFVAKFRSFFGDSSQTKNAKQLKQQQLLKQKKEKESEQKKKRGRTTTTTATTAK